MCKTEIERFRTSRFKSVGLRVKVVAALANALTAKVVFCFGSVIGNFGQATSGSPLRQRVNATDTVSMSVSVVSLNLATGSSGSSEKRDEVLVQSSTSSSSFNNVWMRSYNAWLSASLSFWRQRFRHRSRAIS